MKRIIIFAVFCLFYSPLANANFGTLDNIPDMHLLKPCTYKVNNTLSDNKHVKNEQSCRDFLNSSPLVSSPAILEKASHTAYQAVIRRLNERL